MPTVRDILARKGSDVITMAPGDTVLDAARAMNREGIGGVPVSDAGTLIGIFTERDMLRRVVAEQRDPARITLRDVMTTTLVTCTPDTEIEACAAIMTERRLRHLLVVDERGLCGMVTIGDLLAFRLHDQQATIDELHRYVFDGRLPEPPAARAGAP